MKISIGRVWKKICTASMAIFAVVFGTAVVGGTGTATYHYHLHGQLAEEGDTHVHGVPAHSNPSSHQSSGYTDLDYAWLSSQDFTLEGGISETLDERFYLTEDVDYSAKGHGSIEISGYVRLCLNGFNLDGNYDPMQGGNTIIKVLDGATLVLEDCVGSGEITGGASRIAGGVYVEQGGTFIMEGGTITLNQGLDSDEELPAHMQSHEVFSNSVGAGGVFTDGTFIMNSGYINSNSVSTADQLYALAGGLVIGEYGTFEMNGGAIAGNINLGSTKTYDITLGSPEETYRPRRRAAAGGIYVYGSNNTDPQVTINDGEIFLNVNYKNHPYAETSRDQYYVANGRRQGFAGGIAVEGSSHVDIRGGTISGNQARFGLAFGIIESNPGYFPESVDGGSASPSVITMSGGTITGHTTNTTEVDAARSNNDIQSLIFMLGGRLEITGGSITGNGWNRLRSGRYNASVIRSENGGYIVMSGGEISGNWTDVDDSISTNNYTLYDILCNRDGAYGPHFSATLISGGYLSRGVYASPYFNDDEYINDVRLGVTIEGGYFGEDSGITETDGVLSFESSLNLDNALDTDTYTLQDNEGNVLDDPHYVNGFPYAVYLKGSVDIRGSVLSNPTYDGAPIEEGVDFTVTSDMEGFGYSYSYSSSDSIVVHEGLPTNAGTYTVTASIAIEDRLDTSTTPHTYYDATSGENSFDITIEKRNIEQSFFSYPLDEETTFTYSGTEQYPDVNMTPAVGTGAGNPDYLYSSSSSEYVDVSPIDSGTYYIWATVTEGDNYNAVNDPMYTGLSFEITRANASPSKTPTSIEICEPTTLGSVDLSDYDDSNGTWSWDDPSASVTGTGTYQATYTPNDSNNFNTRTEDVTVSVEGHDWGDWELDGDTHSRTCSRCGAIENSDHNWGLWEVKTAPTESSEGLLRRECATEPGHTEDFTLPELSETNGYTLNTSDPDCENSGEKVYTYEKDGQTFTFYVDIPATGHQWGEWTIIVDPTQDNQGEAQRVCENDESHVETIDLPSLGSGSWIETGRENPDCESAGWVEWTYTPDEGGTISFVETLAPLGHDWGNWESNGDGTHTRTCQRDDAHTETDDCSGGSITDFENGTHGYICDDCGERYDVSSHVWGDWHIDTEPTESQQGTIYRICSGCSAREESTLPALGSGDYSYQVITQPGCETTGQGRYTIQVNDTTLTIDVEIPATGHNYGIWNSNEDGTHSRVCANDPSHVETDSCSGGNLHDLGDGTHGYTCDVCHDDYGASAHDYGSDWIADGSNGHYQECQDCSAHSDTESHTYGEWTVDLAPTQDQAGSMHRECTVCHETETVTLPALGGGEAEGFYTTETRPSTCVAHGYINYYYTDSDGVRVLVATAELPLLDHTFTGNWIADGSNGHYQVCDGCGTHSDTVDHTYDNWTITQTPTEDHSGLLSLICSDCGYTETQVLPAFGGGDAEGFYTTERIESTCTVAGRIDYYYAIEGNRTLIGSVSLPLLDHTFSGSWIADGSSGHYQLCEVCGNSSANMDHSFGEWNVVVEATETQDGEQHRYCEHCGHLEIQTLPATGAEINPGVDGGTTGGVDSSSNYKYLWLIPPLLFLMIVVTTGVVVRTSDR